eukprot:GHVT01101319.1.p1 GENE.GHVT01101319.1~~GHVT01101319.1.p1  ORF type:complete len:300 (+),score=80.31 GHVT01101319.1:267-1166(+)
MDSFRIAGVSASASHQRPPPADARPSSTFPPLTFYRQTQNPSGTTVEAALLSRQDRLTATGAESETNFAAVAASSVCRRAGENLGVDSQHSTQDENSTRQAAPVAIQNERAGAHTAEEAARADGTGAAAGGGSRWGGEASGAGRGAAGRGGAARGGGKRRKSAVDWVQKTRTKLEELREKTVKRKRVTDALDRNLSVAEILPRVRRAIEQLTELGDRKTSEINTEERLLFMACVELYIASLFTCCEELAGESQGRHQLMHIYSSAGRLETMAQPKDLLEELKSIQALLQTFAFLPPAKP